RSTAIVTPIRGCRLRPLLLRLVTNERRPFGRAASATTALGAVPRVSEGAVCKWSGSHSVSIATTRNHLNRIPYNLDPHRRRPQNLPVSVKHRGSIRLYHNRA